MALANPSLPTVNPRLQVVTPVENRRRAPLLQRVFGGWIVDDRFLPW